MDFVKLVLASCGFCCWLLSRGQRSQWQWAMNVFQDFPLSSPLLNRETHTHTVSESLDILPPTGQLYGSKRSLLLSVSYIHWDTTQPRVKEHILLIVWHRHFRAPHLSKTFPVTFRYCIFCFLTHYKCPMEWNLFRSIRVILSKDEHSPGTSQEVPREQPTASNHQVWRHAYLTSIQNSKQSLTEESCYQERWLKNLWGNAMKLSKPQWH